MKVKVPSLTTLYTNEECQRRGNWVWTTCPKSLRSRALAGNRTRDLLITSPTPYRCATTPPLTNEQTNISRYIIAARCDGYAAASSCACCECWRSYLRDEVTSSHGIQQVLRPPSWLRADCSSALTSSVVAWSSAVRPKLSTVCKLAWFLSRYSTTWKRAILLYGVTIWQEYKFRPISNCTASRTDAKF